ncbi:MAG: EcsC family protein [Firmicutes bacterium]|jgi:hypothetical protein|nr:EcsC family protein [Bacillota bacterium]
MDKYRSKMRKLNMSERKLIYSFSGFKVPRFIEERLGDKRELLFNKGEDLVYSVLSSNKSPLLIKDKEEYEKNLFSGMKESLDKTKFEKMTSLFSGALSGFGGIGFTLMELPVLVGFIISYNYKMGADGFIDKDHQMFDHYCLVYLVALLSDDKDTKDRYLRVARSIELGHGEGMLLDQDRLVRDLSRVITRSLMSKKVLQTVPVAGAGFGFAVNFSYMNRIQKLWNIQKAKRILFES